MLASQATFQRLLPTELQPLLSSIFSHSSSVRRGVSSAEQTRITHQLTWYFLVTVPWLYPAEIFPLEVRAKGNAWGVVGWSIGNGWLTLLCPVMFEAIGEKTLYVFGVANVITLPMVWALYPESNQRTLEEMDLLFAADTPWNWDAERNFPRLKEENPTMVEAARRGSTVFGDEEKAGARQAPVVEAAA
jgi:hypothetical protein